ncbi:exported hypothetical protein [Candidatus Sulfotelmatomonas gaucii]|uniref:Lipoprotein n=1 Tax=Candidatus Sulfuritelmatomonas gaucii TaxID=2043161 RepID=A0A2N9L6S1_9BACT|nr:exported hypothetical protein [Candidatus Sulfotelmatomonas gaucii]
MTRTFVFAGLLFTVALPAAIAQSASDACSLLTQAQVSAAVGAQVGAGTYVMPTFKTTCTWTATGKIVTLMTTTPATFEAGKTSPAYKVVPAGGIGDDAYYVVTGGTMVSLITKKGSVAFKTSVYIQLPVDTLENMEKTLALEVASKL